MALGPFFCFVISALMWGAAIAFERSRLPSGTFTCPICGQDRPHSADGPIHAAAAAANGPH
jgi:hypothetical protein